MNRWIIGILVIIIIFTSIGYMIKESESNSPLYFIKNSMFQILIDSGIKENLHESIPIKSSNFVITEYISGLSKPTTMIFVDEGILVLQKNDGKIRLIQNDVLLPEPVLDLEVANVKESGLLGIEKYGEKIFIFLTESNVDGGIPIANRVYQYDWKNGELINPKLVLELSTYHPQHIGGVLASAKDGTIFAITGDQTDTGPRCPSKIKDLPEYPCRVKGQNNGYLQNVQTGKIDDTSAIFAINSNFPVIPSKTSDPLSHYYAIGIRNSFGLAIDPQTNYLWQTENGPDKFDEINLVFPKFNSGWKNVMGPANDTEKSLMIKEFEYSDPEFSWQLPVAPTAISFGNSESLESFNDKVLVADCYGYGSGHLYMFKLNDERTGFEFESEHLKDKIVNFDGKETESMEEITIVKGLGCITDIEFGPDGLPYIVSHLNGKILKITPE